jgi:hypothetical protein
VETSSKQEETRQVAEKARLAQQAAEKARRDEEARQVAEKARLDEEAQVAEKARLAQQAAEKARLAQQRASSAVLCGRSINYEVDGTGAPGPHRSFLGVWPDASWNAGICGSLVVERVQSDGAAQIIYVYGPNGPDSTIPWLKQSPRAVIKNGQLSFRDKDGADFVFILTKDDTLHAHFDGSTTLDAVFRRDPYSVLKK